MLGIEKYMFLFMNTKKSQWSFMIFFLVTFFLLTGPIYGARFENFPQQSSRDNFDQFVRDEILVKLKTDDVKSFRRVRVPEKVSQDRVLRDLRQNLLVEYAEPNYLARAFFIPNDTYYSFQWNFSNKEYGGIGLESAWDISKGDSVIVAVLDTGVAYEDFGWKYRLAPDLAQTNFTSGYDFINNDTHPNDDHGHGTHVAGTIAQSTNNHEGVAGIAYKTTIMPVKVLDKNGVGSYADIAQGIIWAADHEVEVINLSLGASFASQTLENALAYAHNQGVVIVAAAGNDGTDQISFPAAYDEYVISVGATRFDENLAFYSNFGSRLSLVAPGGDLSVDQNNDGYGDGILQQTFNRRPYRFGYYFYQGTSMAAAHVSGVAALVMSTGVTTPDAVESALQESAKDLGETGWDLIYGWGRVDAAAALGVVEDASEPTPTPTPIPATPTPESEDDEESAEINVEIARVSARTVRNGNYNIKAKIENLAEEDVTVTVQARVFNENGTSLVDDSLLDQVVFLPGGEDEYVRWQDSCSLSPGEYLVKISVIEDPSVVGQDDFRVR